MANTVLTQQVTANFEPNGDGAQLLWEDDDEREDEEDIRLQYVRLYPTVVPVVFNTSGTLSYKGIRTEKKKESVVVFSGESEASVPYPNLYNVKLTRVGGFYDKTGAIVSDVVITFNANKNIVKSTHEGYGVVELEYDVDYRLYTFRFAGVGCPDDPSEETPEDFEPFDKSVLVAIDSAKDAIATHEPSMPNCEDKTGGVNRQPGAKSPRIDLIIDPDYPPSLNQDIGVSTVIVGGCRVRHIPDVSSTVTTNSGVVNEVNLIGEGKLFQEVHELLLFSGSSSVNTEYQAHRTPKLTRKGTFHNKWGTRVTPEFYGAGETVTEVDRPSERVKKNPRKRVVGVDEVVATDDWGNVLEIYGVVLAEYNYSYRLFELAFAYDDDANKFIGSNVNAFLDKPGDDPDQPAHLEIGPPTMKGNT